MTTPDPGADPTAGGRFDLSAEGDVNLSPLRRAYEAKHVHGATRALLDEDARHFLHQSLSTPCFDALVASDGIWLEDVAGEKAMAWVQEQNARSKPAIEGEAGFQALVEKSAGLLKRVDAAMTGTM